MSRGNVENVVLPSMTHQIPDVVIASLKYDFLLNFFHPLLAGAYRRRSSFSVVKLSGTQ